MQADLEALKPKLIVATEETEQKMVVVSREKEVADGIRAKVAVEEAAAQKQADEANEIREDCQQKLADALPILKEADQAVNCISRNDISTLKKLPQPPKDAKMVMSAVCVLMGQKPERKIDPETQKPYQDYWSASVKLMNNADFLKNVLEFDRENISAERI